MSLYDPWPIDDLDDGDGRDIIESQMGEPD